MKPKRPISSARCIFSRLLHKAKQIVSLWKRAHLCAIMDVNQSCGIKAGPDRQLDKPLFGKKKKKSKKINSALQANTDRDRKRWTEKERDGGLCKIIIPPSSLFRYFSLRITIQPRMLNNHVPKSRRGNWNRNDANATEKEVKPTKLAHRLSSLTRFPPGRLQIEKKKKKQMASMTKQRKRL